MSYALLVKPLCITAEIIQSDSGKSQSCCQELLLLSCTAGYQPLWLRWLHWSAVGPEQVSLSLSRVPWSIKWTLSWGQKPYTFVSLCAFSLTFYRSHVYQVCISGGGTLRGHSLQMTVLNKVHELSLVTRAESSRRRGWRLDCGVNQVDFAHSHASPWLL